ncbi:alpha/beta hydrolase [Streptomyces sp. NPDC006235]|uniref:alpha/beta hydrolase n=1 Tax=Streptomyces sp. NPDC006235 TaxID=3156736 RepID=UPI0033AB06F5
MSFASAVRDLSAAAAGDLAEPGPDLSALLALLSSPKLADSLVGGALFMCGDGGWPADPETYWRNSVRSRATEPVFGPLVNGMIASCAFWLTAPREPGTGIANSVPCWWCRPGATTTSPAPVRWRLHRRLTGSRLVTADIRSHGVHGRGAEGLTPPVPCADRLVNGYLGTGRLSAGDVECAGEGARS